MEKIKFQKYYVTDGVSKVRVYYSHGMLTTGKECVTLYAKSYAGNLGKIFGSLAENNSDMQTDYFEKDKVRIYSDNPLYNAALARCA